MASTYHPDVMVMGETLNNIGAPGTLDSKAETVPGPSTDYVAAVARTYRTNIAFGLVERVDNLLYNTAVLIDRTGAIIGKHHKVQLPLADAPSLPASTEWVMVGIGYAAVPERWRNNITLCELW